MSGSPIALAGCTPTPLSNYLKAVGVLRLIVEQEGGDPGATAFWSDGCFVLETGLTRERIETFFLGRYQPSPIIAPWNGGSGFYSGDNQDGIGPLRKAKAARFEPMVSTIAAATDLLEQEGLTRKPDGDNKVRLLARLRAELPDEALEWFDAAVVLAGDQPKYPPLLGTGGNDGRLDFTNNFMQRIVELFDVDSGTPRDGTKALLQSALFGDSVRGLASAAVGQFAPGAAGGPNAATGFDADSLVNPWDFVLMLEGALLFASAATRRLESADTAAASFPFTVRPTAAGSGGVALADEKIARAEMWMPLWGKPASLVELKALFAEGRATTGRMVARTARDGLDFARAVAKLGVNRGIDAFQRYAFVMRSGKAYLATPLERFRVERNPHADLIDQLDRGGWLSRFRYVARNSTGRAGQLVRRLEDALFELLRTPDRGTSGQVVALRTQEVLNALGAIELYLGSSPAMRQECAPVPRLGWQWVRDGDDRSHEYRIAAALAGLSSAPLPPGSYELQNPRNAGLPVASHLAPVHPRDPARWYEQSRLVTWRNGSFVDNLYHMIQRRLIVADGAPLADKPFAGTSPADLAAVGAFIAGQTDDGRIKDLLAGLSLCTPCFLPRRKESSPLPLPLPYLIIKPLFVPDSVLQGLPVEGLPNDVRLPLPGAIPAVLHAGRVGDALRLAVQRRRGSRVNTPSIPAADVSINGPRLLAGLAVPISDRDTAAVFKRTEQIRKPETASVPMTEDTD